jgi:hypothetical protein
MFVKNPRKKNNSSGFTKYLLVRIFVSVTVVNASGEGSFIKLHL